MRTMLIALAGLSLSLPAIAADGWRTFHDPEGIFSFDAPSEVSVAKKPVTTVEGGDGEATIYTYGPDTKGSSSCVASKAKPASGSVFLADTRGASSRFKDQMSRLGIKPDWDTDTTLDGHVGSRLDVTTVIREHWSMRWFMANGAMYTFMCITQPKASDAERDEVTRVAKSFHFTQ